MQRSTFPTSSPDRVGPYAPSVRFNRLRLGIVVLGVLVILAFAGSSAYDAWRSYRYSIKAAEREIGNEANALAEQTSWTLQAVDLLLLDTARWYRSDSEGIPPERLDAALATRTAGLQQVRQVMIIDAQGNQRYRSRALSTPTLNISDRSYFTAQRDNAGCGPVHERAAGDPFGRPPCGGAFSPSRRRPREFRGNRHGHRRPRGSESILSNRQRRHGRRDSVASRRRHIARAQSARAEARGTKVPCARLDADIAGRQGLQSDRRDRGLHCRCAGAGHSFDGCGDAESRGGAAALAQRDDPGRGTHPHSDAARRVDHCGAPAADTARRQPARRRCEKARSATRSPWRARTRAIGTGTSRPTTCSCHRK